MVPTPFQDAPTRLFGLLSKYFGGWGRSRTDTSLTLLTDFKSAATAHWLAHPYFYLYYRDIDTRKTNPITTKPNPTISAMGLSSKNGWHGWNQTSDLSIISRMLYHLSYTPLFI